MSPSRALFQPTIDDGVIVLTGDLIDDEMNFQCFGELLMPVCNYLVDAKCRSGAAGGYVVAGAKICKNKVGLVGAMKKAILRPTKPGQLARSETYSARLFRKLNGGEDSEEKVS